MITTFAIQKEQHNGRWSSISGSFKEMLCENITKFHNTIYIDVFDEQSFDPLKDVWTTKQ